MLRRLESQGLLTSEWREEDKRNKRFYRLSPDGARDARTTARRVAPHQRFTRSHSRGGLTTIVDIFGRTIRISHHLAVLKHHLEA